MTEAATEPPISSVDLRKEFESVAIAPVPLLERAEARVVAHPATQSHLLIGMPGIRRDDPDYFSLYVGNYILGGGGFVSRLTSQVREQRGYAYSVYSYFAPQRDVGPFQIGLQTKRSQARDAIKLARGILDDFVKNGPSAEELAAVPEGANMGLGCGNPQLLASLRPGETVLASELHHRPGGKGGNQAVAARRQASGPGPRRTGCARRPGAPARRTPSRSSTSSSAR